MNINGKKFALIFMLLIAFIGHAQEDKYAEKLRSLYELEQYEAIIKFKSKKETEMSSMSLFYKGMAYYMTDKDRSALTYFNNAISKGPATSDMYYYRGITLYYLQKYEESLGSFDAAIEIIPGEPDFKMGKGYSLYKLERYNEAEAMFLEAEKLEGCSNRVYHVLGNLYFDIKSYDAAISYYQKALKFNEPRSDNYRNISYNLILVQQISGKYEGAMETLKEHLIMYPEDFQAVARQIQIYYALGLYADAEPNKMTLKTAYKKGQLPSFMRDMYCFDQFMWNDENMMAFSAYEVTDKDILPWRHKIFPEDDEKPENDFKILTLLDSVALKSGKLDEFYLVKIQSDTIYRYNHIVITESTPYPDFKAAVLEVLNGNVEPIEKTGNYEAWMKEQRAARSSGLGTSFETAIVVKSVPEEYQWIRDNYPGSQVEMQALLSNGGKMYDMLRFKTADGDKMEIYFDITSFFGKY